MLMENSRHLQPAKIKYIIGGQLPRLRLLLPNTCMRVMQFHEMAVVTFRSEYQALSYLAESYSG